MLTHKGLALCSTLLCAVVWGSEGNSYGAEVGRTKRGMGLSASAGCSVPSMA